MSKNCLKYILIVFENIKNLTEKTKQNNNNNNKTEIWNWENKDQHSFVH